MKLFNFGKKEEQHIPSVVEEKSGGDMVNNIINLAMQTSLPIIKEGRDEYISYKTDEGEEYPIYLEKLYNTSPTHQAIVETKSLIVAGDGFEIDDTNLTDEQRLHLNKLLEYTDGKRDIEDLIRDLSKDMELYGSICIEVIWSLDFTKIVKITRISPKHIRSGKFIDGCIENYYYSRDWSDRRAEIKPIRSFDINNKEDHRQLLYVGVNMVSNEYYYEPSYIASCNWIDLEASTGLFYKSLLDNGFNPSMVVKFYRKPANLEERDEIVRNLKSSFAGVKQSGKAMVMFSDGKELAPDVDAIATNNLDKQYIVLAEQIQSKILTGHRVTTPSLFGIVTPGKLGDSDFDVQVEAFNKFVIRPNQQFLNRIINKILFTNGLDVNFRIKPLELGKTNKTEN